MENSRSGFMGFRGNIERMVNEWLIYGYDMVMIWLMMVYNGNIW